MQRVRAAAERLVCQQRLGQIGLALHLFHHNHGRLPPVGVPDSPTRKSAAVHLTWMAALLPETENSGLWMQANEALQTAMPWVNPPHRALATVVQVYVCPSDGRLGTPLTDADGITAAYTSYAAVTGGRRADGVFAGGNQGGLRWADVRDGLTNTLMVGERPPPDTLQAGKWYPRSWFGHGRYGTLLGPAALTVLPSAFPGDPCAITFRFGVGRTDNPCDRFQFWSLHGLGVNFVFADGSTRYLAASTPQEILLALATRDGRELVPPPD